MTPETIAIIGSVVGLLGFILALLNFVLRTIEKFHLKKDELQDEVVGLHKQMNELKLEVGKLTTSVALLTQERDMWRKRAISMLKAYKRLKNEKP